MLSRDDILDGALTRMLIAGGMADLVLSDAARNASLRRVLDQAAGRDVWVFGYGSLIWNPAFRYAERRVGTLRGHHRRFCLWTPLGRGTPESPGLMLALDRGGACRGAAFRVPAAEAATELDVLWRREMVTGSYRPRWATVRTDRGDVRAVAFAIDRGHPRYAGRLPEATVAAVLARARGRLGSGAEYLIQTVDHLDALGIRDRALRRLRRRVAAGAEPKAAAD